MLGLLGAGFGACVAGVPWSAQAAEGGSKVVEIKKGKNGTTIFMELEQAPFPYPGKPYKDSTTIAFVPHHYRMPGSGLVDLVIHFHGHGTSARQAMGDHQLREQFFESKQNAILIMPQGPMNASDGSGGKLGQPDGLLRFLTDLRKTLQLREVNRGLGRAALRGRARIGRVALSSHSGGYHVAAQCLRHGGFDVKEVYLFDSLYGDTSYFRDWVVATKKLKGDKGHKLVCFYAGASVRQQSLRLMKQLQEDGIETLHEESEGQLTRAQLTEGRAIFIRTRLGHSAVTREHNALRDCLFASGFKRRLRSDWFEGSHKKREVEER